MIELRLIVNESRQTETRATEEKNMLHAKYFIGISFRLLHTHTNINPVTQIVLEKGRENHTKRNGQNEIGTQIFFFVEALDTLHNI